MRSPLMVPVLVLAGLASIGIASPVQQMSRECTGSSDIVRLLRTHGEGATTICSSVAQLTVSGFTRTTAGTSQAISGDTADVKTGLWRKTQHQLGKGLPGLLLSQYSPAEISNGCLCLNSPATFPSRMTTLSKRSNACEVRYDASGNGSGNTIAFPLNSDTEEKCCQACQTRRDCVASVFTGGECQHLVSVHKIEGEEMTEQCPLGIERYPFGPPSLDPGARVFAGPCGYH